MLYYLATLLCVVTILGALGLLPYSPLSILFSTAVVTLVCWLINKSCARLFGVAENIESIYITAFILALIISPVAISEFMNLGFLILASVFAMASKYILAIGKKHIFNPAALGVAIAALLLNESASWWAVSTSALMPAIIFGGFLIVRKLQRFDLVLSFATIALAVTMFASSDRGLVTPSSQILFHSAFFFVALIMLTEPLTSPSSRTIRIMYGAIVGFFFVPSVHFGSIYFTPELALLIGNIFSYVASPKGRLNLVLQSTHQVGIDTHELIFAADRALKFLPGQYLEWTLGHVSPDSRGNRRYFTIASSPTEKEIRLGVKIYPKASSFKRALMAMKPGDMITASQLAGNFVLPKDTKQKLVFIAGGIGITPFRSMVQYMLDTREVRPTILFYSNKSAENIAYKDFFEQAKEKLGVKIIYLATDEKKPIPDMYTEYLNAEIIAREAPDYRERTFYISGPNRMVTAFKKTLRKMGVSRRKIKTDFFPGFTIP